MSIPLIIDEADNNVKYYSLVRWIKRANIVLHDAIGAVAPNANNGIEQMSNETKRLSGIENEDVQHLSELENLENEITNEFAIVQHLGREMLKRRRENMKMRGNSAPGPRYLNDLTHIGYRLADRLLSVHAIIFRLIAQLEKERLPFLSEERAAGSLTLQHIERMERNLRRWDNVRYRLLVH